MAERKYTELLDKLLKLNPAEGSPEVSWPDYITEAGVSLENVPELTQLATDFELRNSEEDDVSYWGPVHAWRALSQLKAASAAEELTKTFDWEDDDYPNIEMPGVFGKLGPSTIPVLQKYLSDPTHEYYPRGIPSEGLIQIAINYPEAREQCIEVLTQQLALYEQNPPQLNAFLVIALDELKAESALPVIEAAFNAEAVDIDFIDWNSVQFKFGLISKETYEAKNLEISAERRRRMLAEMGVGNILPNSAPERQPGRSTTSSSKKVDRAKIKSKRKMAKVSKKKNRKK